MHEKIACLKKDRDSEAARPNQLSSKLTNQLSLK